MHVSLNGVLYSKSSSKIRLCCVNGLYFCKPLSASIGFPNSKKAQCVGAINVAGSDRTCIKAENDRSLLAKLPDALCHTDLVLVLVDKATIPLVLTRLDNLEFDQHCQRIVMTVAIGVTRLISHGSDEYERPFESGLTHYKCSTPVVTLEDFKGL